MSSIELNVTFDSGQDFAVGFEQEQSFEIEMDGILPGDYQGEYRFTPSATAQTIPTAGKTRIYNAHTRSAPSGCRTRQILHIRQEAA